MSVAGCALEAPASGDVVLPGLEAVRGLELEAPALAELGDTFTLTGGVMVAGQLDLGLSVKAPAFGSRRRNTRGSR